MKNLNKVDCHLFIVHIRLLMIKKKKKNIKNFSIFSLLELKQGYETFGTDMCFLKVFTEYKKVDQYNFNLPRSTHLKFNQVKIL